MKQAAILTLLTWGAIMLEQVRPDVLPADAIVLPLVAVGMLWHGHGFGILLGGALLIVDGIIRPQGIMLLPVAIAFTATLILSLHGSQNSWQNGRRQSIRLTRWILPLLPVFVGVITMFGPALVTSQMTLAAAIPLIGRFLLIAIPWGLLLSGLMLLAGEFGLRRPI